MASSMPGYRQGVAEISAEKRLSLRTTDDLAAWLDERRWRVFAICFNILRNRMDSEDSAFADDPTACQLSVRAPTAAPS